MRLAGGSRARQAILAPKGTRTRPTSAKVREALFGILKQRVQSARVLDLFAGSGALGLEAMSRGAASVVFVDNDASAVMTIRRNAVRVRHVHLGRGVLGAVAHRLDPRDRLGFGLPRGLFERLPVRHG